MYEIKKTEEQDPARLYRVVCRLPPQLVKMAGTNGHNTEGGLWIDAYGPNPELALKHLFETVGRLLLFYPERLDT